MTKTLADIFAPYSNPYRAVEASVGTRISAPVTPPPPSEVKKGHWDPETGRIVYEDKSVSVSTVVGLPVPRASETKPVPPKPDPVKAEAQPVSTPKPKLQRRTAPTVRKFDPLTDPRRERVIQLYQQGLCAEQVAAHQDVRMRKEHVASILGSAGVKRKPGRRTRGDSKLTPQLAVEIYQSTEATSVLAERYGVTAMTVRRIRNGSRWQEVTGANQTTAADRKSQEHPRKAEIIARYESGKSSRKIASELRMCSKTVREVLRQAGKLKRRGKEHVHPWAVPPEKVVEVLAARGTVVEIAARFGICTATVWRIRARARMSHGDKAPERCE